MEERKMLGELSMAHYIADDVQPNAKSYMCYYAGIINTPLAVKGPLDPRSGIWKMYRSAVDKEMFVKALIALLARNEQTLHEETMSFYDSGRDVLDTSLYE